MKTITGKIIALAIVMSGLIFSQSALAACNKPTGLSTTAITASSATLNWGAISNALNYNIRYRIVSTSTWTTQNAVTATSVSISGLTESANYEWQVQTKCSATQTSGWTNSVTFTTPAPPCNVATGLNTVNISTTSASFKWLAVTGAQSYNVQYRAVGAPSWTTISTSLTSVLVSSLLPSTGYEWNVQTDCGNSNTSAFSSVVTFTTATTCAVPTGLTSSGVTATDASIS
ncbi:MAG TPA: fibronectin type III domain-containing protein, partial [Bacteroidia bacterium]|nr:fibronectin type III domain-containing protein [Bacteroidia bacterium]